MKKALFATIAIVLLLMPLICLADSLKPTEKRGVSEFTELFVKRLYNYVDNDSSMLKNYNLGRKNYSTPFGDCMMVQTTAGMLTVNISTFDVESLTTTFFILDATDTINEKYYISCIASISALEYDVLKETTMPLETFFSKEKKNVVSEAETILSEAVNKTFADDELVDRLLNNGEELLIYQGNYDYYFMLSTNENSNGETVESIYLIAEARK